VPLSLYIFTFHKRVRIVDIEFSVPSSWSANTSNFRQKGAIAIRQPYLRVVGMEQATDAHSVGGSAYNTDEVRHPLYVLFTPARFSPMIEGYIFD
jgi:hypothetical protein